jgi:hypothetical protein
VTLTGRTVTVILSDDARDAMQRAVAETVDPLVIAGLVQDTDELGVWLRVGPEDDKRVLLLRWEYVLSVTFPAREQERLGLRP